MKVTPHIAALLAIVLIFTLGTTTTTSNTPPPENINIEDNSQLTLSFSGDLIQHMPQLSAARNGDGTYDFSKAFTHIDTVWKQVDFAIINYETTISTNGKYTGFPCFSSPPDIAKQLYKSGVRIAAMANNHCCDKGRRGIQTTATVLDSIGFRTLGAYTAPERANEFLMLIKGRYRVALLNYTYGTNGIPVPKGAFVNLIDTAQMRLDIRRARVDSSATHVVAFMHWGEEYQRKSNKKQREIATWCRANGIDVVVGSHPHVVQEIDTVNQIVYSLGNFVSNQKDRYTDSGLTVVVRLDHHHAPQIEYVPHWCDKLTSDRKEKYRVLTPRDTVLLKGESLRKMKSAIQEARQAVGAANEYKFQ